MNLPPAVDGALRRLSAALDLLDATAERRAKTDLSRSDLQEELAVMQDDRARLAVELDGALTQTRSLQNAHTEVARRLDRATVTIRSILGEPDPEGDE